ncbi:hypothetical protein BC827DRAFT_1177625 [Russula dissimulans]|nr:hypothetical protein BC827DRAFT_1177625 [Russula dissimulans]
MYVQGCVLDSSDKPVLAIETWETDDKSYYNTQHAERHVPACRGRLRTDAEGRCKIYS